MFIRIKTTVTGALGVAALVCTSFSLTACHSRGGTSVANAAVIPSARVVAAQRGNISLMLTLAGQFQPYQAVDVHPKVSGYMRHIYVDIGDVVHQGQTLATLEVPELKAQLQQTVFQVDQARDEMRRAQHEINRAEAQHAAVHEQYVRLMEAAKGHPGLIAQQELDNAQAADLASEAQVDEAKSAMSAAHQHMGSAQSDNLRVKALHDHTNVVAPISGVVVWRYADTGALIQGGTNSNSQDLPIVRLSQSSLLRLRVPVPEQDVRFVHEGDQLQVRVDAIGRSFTGKIVRFTRDVNSETRTMQTEVDVNNRDLTISPGMYANSALRLALAEDVVTVPLEAIVLKNGQQFVYAIDSSNRVRIQPVVAGLEGSKLTEIKSGLAAGDRVIVGGQDKYHEGDTIAPVVATAPASEVQQSGGMIDLKADGGAH